MPWIVRDAPPGKVVAWDGFPRLTGAQPGRSALLDNQKHLPQREPIDGRLTSGVRSAHRTGRRTTARPRHTRGLARCDDAGMDLESGRDDNVPSDAAEAARIRAVYKQRDASPRRGVAVQAASLRLAAERLDLTRRLLGRLLSDPRPSLLDVGCGGGGDLARFRSAGWPADRLAGVDLIPNRLDAAREACPDCDLRLSQGSAIPFPDESVDVATAVTVFSSILDADVRAALFAEMERVVRPSGLIVVYDFVIRKPTNLDVIGMPLGRLTELGRPPTGSIRLSPALPAVAVATAVHPRLADWAMRFAPRTHRLSYWRKPPSVRRGSPAAPSSQDRTQPAPP